MLTNSGTRPSVRAKSSAISTSKPTSRSGCDGSASTNGAPPSGSPAHLKVGASVDAKAAEKAENADAAGSESACAAAIAATARPTISTRRTNLYTMFFVNLRAFVPSWEATRANTGVDSTRRRFDGDCWFYWNGTARQRHGGADAAPGRHGDGVESHRGEGARARTARGNRRGGARRCRRRR